MEIKVQCQCGARFAFAVEPVNGRMPCALACPKCGADATANANAVITQRLTPMMAIPLEATPAAPPAASPIIPRIVTPAAPPAVPSAPVPSAPPSPEPLAGAGKLRINRSHSPAAATPSAPSVSSSSGRAVTPITIPNFIPLDPNSAPPVVDRATGKTVQTKSGFNILNRFGFLRGMNLKSAAWALVVIVVAIYNVGSKIYDRFRSVSDTIHSVSHDGDGGAWTLPSDNGVMFIVKHPDANAVSEACVEYWRDVAKKPLTAAQIPDFGQLGNDARYLIYPAYNGCVQIDGPIDWEEAQVATFHGMAEHVSRKLGVLTVAAVMGDDAEAGIFTVFDKGEKTFRCEITLTIAGNDIKEVVKVEGDAWAGASGFKPGESYQKFTMEDANALTLHLGMNTADQEPKGGIVLKEAKAP